MTKDELNKTRYNEAAHAMQTGVMYELKKDPTSATPKHLRVGINSAMVTDQAIAELLIEKGIITESEYLEKVADCMVKEKLRFEEELKVIYGIDIKLA